MMHRLLTALLILGLGLGGTAQAAGLVKKFSPHSVGETMDRLEKVVNDKGLTVFLRIDHQANAKKIGLQMPESQVLIFGNPKMGTLIMQGNPAAGLDLPLRVVVYSSDDGRTWVAYHDPREIGETFGLQGNKALTKAEGALGKLTGAAVR